MAGYCAEFTLSYCRRTPWSGLESGMKANIHLFEGDRSVRFF